MKQPFQGPESELTERLIGMAMKIHRTLGPGLDERSYENSLCIDLTEEQVDFTQQESFPVLYKGKVVSRLITDLIVGGSVIVENKVVKAINDLHIAQLLSCLAVTGLPVGLIFNFAKPSLEFKRVVRTA